MGMAAADFFLNYCERVLGMRALPRKVNRRPSLLVIDIPWPGGLANDDMFRKMMSGLGLDSKSFDVAESLPAEVHGLRSIFEGRSDVLCFSRELGEAIEKMRLESPGLSFGFTTVMGPRDLRQAPEKKRDTWEILKSLKARLPS